MADQTPSIGRIVHYTLTDQDADTINRRRRMEGRIYAGNTAQAGDVYPMLITRVWGDDSTAAVNGQVLLDGNDAYWATSITAGEGPRHYTWPAQV